MSPSGGKRAHGASSRKAMEGRVVAAGIYTRRKGYCACWRRKCSIAGDTAVQDLVATVVTAVVLALVLALLAITLALSLVHEGLDAKSCRQ